MDTLRKLPELRQCVAGLQASPDFQRTVATLQSLPEKERLQLAEEHNEIVRRAFIKAGQ